MEKSGQPSIESVDRHDGDEIHIGFSDGTVAVYTIGQLLELAPNRVKSEPEQDE